MVIILENDEVKSQPWGEYFNSEDAVLPCHLIKNWSDVVDNIKDINMRNDAIASGCLFGVEYPADTPLVGGRDDEDN